MKQPCLNGAEDATKSSRKRHLAFSILTEDENSSTTTRGHSNKEKKGKEKKMACKAQWKDKSIQKTELQYIQFAVMCTTTTTIVQVWAVEVPSHQPQLRFLLDCSVLDATRSQLLTISFRYLPLIQHCWRYETCNAAGEFKFLLSLLNFSVNKASYAAGQTPRVL